MRYKEKHLLSCGEISVATQYNGMQNVIKQNESNQIKNIKLMYTVIKIN